MITDTSNRLESIGFRPERLAQRGDMDLERVFLDDHAGPDGLEQLVLLDDLACPRDEHDQGLERLGAERDQLVAPPHAPLGRVDPERTELVVHGRSARLKEL